MNTWGFLIPKNGIWIRDLTVGHFYKDDLHRLVDPVDALVESCPLLACNEAGEAHLLPSLLHSSTPVGDSSFPLLRKHGFFLGDDLAALVHHEILLGQTPDGFHAGALPDLPLLPDGLRLLRLLGLARNSAPSGSAFRGAALARHPAAGGLRGRGLSGSLSAFAGHAGFSGDTTGGHGGFFVEDVV